VASTYRLVLDGEDAAATLLSSLTSVEVEENADLPDAALLTLAVSRSEDGEIDVTTGPGLQPFVNLAVVATPEGGDDECVFDGYVLSQKLHLERGLTNSSVEVWAQDASWLMNLEEKTREWVDVTDGDVANSIFGEYDGFTPADANTDDDSPSHTEDGHSLMQRGTDIQFLRMLARRSGKLCRVACNGAPGNYTATFAKPDLDGEPVATLELNDLENWTAESLDIEWDVTRPTEAAARQALLTDDTPEGVAGDTTDSGLAPLDDRDLAAFAGRATKVMLTAPVDDGGELSQRATAVLRDGGWFVRCEGDADVGRLGAVLRVGRLVALSGIGSVHSGNYVVWNVRHKITASAHRMHFTLRRNAVGPQPSGGLL
jgi:hypothetical protein